MAVIYKINRSKQIYIMQYVAIKSETHGRMRLGRLFTFIVHTVEQLSFQNMLKMLKLLADLQLYEVRLRGNDRRLTKVPFNLWVRVSY